MQTVISKTVTITKITPDAQQKRKVTTKRPDNNMIQQ